MESLNIKLFDTIKKFNKIINNKYNTYKKLNANDLILCGLLYKAKEESQTIQVKDLSYYMGISRPAVNTILNRLEARGTIERFRVKEDRKSVFVRLTKKAYQLYELEKEKLSKFMQGLINNLGENNAIKLNELLGKVNIIMEEEV